MKATPVELLQQELPRKRIVGTIGTGSMSDPYSPVESRYGLMRKALRVLADSRFPVHIITKSELVTRNIDLQSETPR